MWLIAGTIPEIDFPCYANVSIQADNAAPGHLILPDGRSLAIGRGTAALVATAIAACNVLGAPAPHILLVGDQGTGDGSRSAYEWLAANIGALVAKHDLQGLTLHYFYPDLDGHNRLFMALEEAQKRPLLVADAGFMYVAKMSGYATRYDLFTPDMGELAFLADEKAPHPFYTRGFLSAGANDIPQLLARAIKYDNCPPNLIIKGSKDYIVCENKLMATVAEPSVPAMECIGGTGDIVTGMATAYLAAGYPICKSAFYAACATRQLASFCQPDPSWQAADLIARIKPMFQACREIMENPDP